MYQRIIVPRILQPKTAERVIEPKNLRIENQVIKKEPKKLLVAAGAGGIPPSGNGDNLPSMFKNNLSPEILKKIHTMTGNLNKMTHKGFDIFNKCSKF